MNFDATGTLIIASGDSTLKNQLDGVSVPGAPVSPGTAKVVSNPLFIRQATGARMLPDSLGPKAWQDGRTRPKPPKGPSFRQRFERGDI